MATYPFVPGIDYGPRKGTLGWNVHMAEGGNGTVGWLSQRSGESRVAWANRINGVSASFVILTTGAVVQMVPWGNAAGNLNPNDRSTDKAFYGKRFLLEVLGTHWSDPNAYTLSVELCGFRADGPTPAQVESLVKLVAESRERYPDMVGAFGHADQTDTKGCPGTAATMLEFWDRVGHGKFADSAGGDVKFIQASGLSPAPSDKLLRLPLGTPLYGFDGAQVTKTASARDWPYVGLVDAKGGQYVITAGTGSLYADGITRPTLLVARTGTLVDAPAPIVTASDCKAEVAAAVTDATNRDRRIRDAAIAKLREM